MPRIPNFGGVCGFSSMLILATLIRSWYSLAISSRIGAIILHGPHHSAQKSSSTGLSDLTTSCSNDASLICLMCSLICVNTSFGSRPALNARHDTTKSENFPFASPQDKPSNAPREVSWGHLQEGGLAWLCGPLERQFSLNCYALPVVIVRIPTVGFP